jgi:hypothetical protein
MSAEVLHVMGSAAWGYIRREDRVVQKCHQHLGHYGGYDEDLKSHAIVDSGGALVNCSFVSTDHTALYRDHMGAAYQLRLRSIGQALEMEERQHRQVMDVVQAREDLLALNRRVQWMRLWARLQSKCLKWLRRRYCKGVLSRRILQSCSGSMSS